MNSRVGWQPPATFALVYFAGAELGQLLSLKPGNFTALWPPSGLYLAALVLASSGNGRG